MATKNTRASGSTKAKSQDPALQKLFVDSIKDIYWAEKHLLKALPKMSKAATTQELKEGIDKHVAETEEHVVRLERVFELLEKKPQAKKCDAMEGLIAEGQSIVEETEDDSATRDVGVIMASQKIEHYEIATYGCLKQLAITLGYEEMAGIFDQTLSEEMAADQLLTEVAESSINYEAATEEEEE
jgi:ferritin-like metal-binding protein YciE